MTRRGKAAGAPPAPSGEASHMSPQTPRSSPAAQEGSAGSETEGRLSPGTGRPLELKAFVQEAAEKLSEVASPPLRTGSGCRLSSERSFKTEERCVPGVEDLAPKLGVPSLSLLGSGMEAVAAGACEESLEIPYEFEQRVILQGPDGPIVMNAWDLAKFRFWRFDHYQELRREWLAQKDNSDSVVRRFAIPHPGVDYFYHSAPFLAHAGGLRLTAVAAQCLLPDGAALSADVDFRRYVKPRQANAPLCNPFAGLQASIARSGQRLFCVKPRIIPVENKV